MQKLRSIYSPYSFTVRHQGRLLDAPDALPVRLSYLYIHLRFRWNQFIQYHSVNSLHRPIRISPIAMPPSLTEPFPSFLPPLLLSLPLIGRTYMTPYAFPCQFTRHLNATSSPSLVVILCDGLRPMVTRFRRRLITSRSEGFIQSGSTCLPDRRFRFRCRRNNLSLKRIFSFNFAKFSI